LPCSTGSVFAAPAPAAGASGDLSGAKTCTSGHAGAIPRAPEARGRLLGVEMLTLGKHVMNLGFMKLGFGCPESTLAALVVPVLGSLGFLWVGSEIWELGRSRECSSLELWGEEISTFALYVVNLGFMKSGIGGPGSSRESLPPLPRVPRASPGWGLTPGSPLAPGNPPARSFGGSNFGLCDHSCF